MVSVIIPTYNRAHLIERSARSVLNQTYRDLELIIVDDGSTDETEQIVKSIDDSRLLYIKQQNAGACAARNNGIEHAKGEYIAFHDSDDVWHADKLEKQIKYLKENDADVVCCKLNKIDEVKGCLISQFPNHFKQGFLKTNDSPMGIGTQSLLFKRQVLMNNYFDFSMPRLQEFELLLRLRKNYKIYFLDEGLVDYYIQADSISSNPVKLYNAIKRICEIHPEVKTEAVTSKQLSNNLISNSIKLKKNQKDIKNKMLSLSLELDSSLKNRIRYAMIKCHVYRAYAKFVQFKVWVKRKMQD